MAHRNYSGGVIKSLGLVFGDIGTNPIFTVPIIFLLIKPTEANVMGVLSLIVWTLIIIVCIEYTWLAMSLGQRGEGGTIVLMESLIRLLKSERQIAFVTFLSFIGISFLIGDGVITPAISMLSAVEGIRLIPRLEGMRQEILILIAGLIAIFLFAFQRKGSEKIAGTFGPVMLVWFLSLSASGIISIMQVPSVMNSINPYYAVKFLSENGMSGFFVLSGVFLCATGAEVLDADMGHLGKKPIIKAWYFVLIAIVLNYLGQGAFLIQHPDAKNILFEMVFQQTQILYIFIPFLVLSIIATVITSQSMISGMFSVVYQGITTRIMPMFKVDYTSNERKSQIFIGSVNWFLLVSVLCIMSEFRESHNLGAAYSLSVACPMVVTGIIMTWIFYLNGKILKCIISLLVSFADIAFLLSNIYKIPVGGYWSIIIASVPLSMIMIYTAGQKRLYRKAKPIKLATFLVSYDQVYKGLNKIKGTALFFSKNINEIPSYIVHTMFVNNIIYEENIIVSMVVLNEPFGVTDSFTDNLANGLRVFEIYAGYKEVLNVNEILKKAGITEKVIFYGQEDIVPSNMIWGIFSIIKKLTPSFVQFYELTTRRLHGVAMRIEM
ncbi:MAG: KUP/HAK/KT family potassium transporter [Candidatus Brocadiaceae bacterium]|nr:KUP/HAK/KT family potassium transporter [Candidatus Brocadiaceae bacterium]